MNTVFEATPDMQERANRLARIPFPSDNLDIACSGIHPATWVGLLLIGLTFWAALYATALHFMRGIA